MSTPPDGPSEGAGAAGKSESVIAAAENAGIRREPELGEHEEIVPPARVPQREFEFDVEDDDGEVAQNLQQADRLMARTARNASLDPDDGMDL